MKIISLGSILLFSCLQIGWEQFTFLDLFGGYLFAWIELKIWSYFLQNRFQQLFFNGFVFVFIIAYYLIFQNFSNKFFSLISFTLFGLPIIGFTIHYAYMSLKFKKSAYLFYGYFYIIFSMLLSNILYQFPKPDGIIEVTMVTRQNIIFFTTIFNVLFIISGIKVYMNTAKQYSRLEQKLF